MGQVVGQTARTRTDKVAKHREIGAEQQQGEEPPARACVGVESDRAYEQYEILDTQQQVRLREQAAASSAPPCVGSVLLAPRPGASGHEHRPDAAVLLVLEHLVAARRRLKREAVCRQVGRVELAVRRVIQQLRQILLPVLAYADCVSGCE